MGEGAAPPPPPSRSERVEGEGAAHDLRIKILPTMMGSLSKLKELDVSFNELESVPESLCFCANLVKLDVGRNFADLRPLPRSIGNLEMLEELDISSNQLRELPGSFRFMSKLRVLNADETPLEVPPRQIVKLGAQPRRALHHRRRRIRASGHGSDHCSSHARRMQTRRLVLQTSEAPSSTSALVNIPSVRAPLLL